HHIVTLTSSCSTSSTTSSTTFSTISSKTSSTISSTEPSRLRAAPRTIRSCIAFSTLSCAFFPYFDAIGCTSCKRLGARKVLGAECWVLGFSLSTQHSALSTSSLVHVARRRHHHGVAALHLHEDFVRAGLETIGAAHLELVVTGERALQAIHCGAREDVRLRVEAARVFRGLAESRLERVVVGERRVEREDRHARRLEHAARELVFAIHQHAARPHVAEAPAHEEHRLRTGDRTERVADDDQRL